MGSLHQMPIQNNFSSSSDGGGGDMEGRVKTLEKAVGDMRVDIAEIKTSVNSHFPNLATKADMAEIKGVMSSMDARINSELPNLATKEGLVQTENRILKWMISTLLVCAGLVITATLGITRLIK